jgi:hypothetical protein
MIWNEKNTILAFAWYNDQKPLAKIANFQAKNLNKNFPNLKQELYPRQYKGNFIQSLHFRLQ